MLENEERLREEVACLKQKNAQLREELEELRRRVDAGGRAAQVSEDAILRAERDLHLRLSETTSLEEALRACLDAAIEVSGMDSGGIYMVNEAGGLDLVVHAGISEAFVKVVSYYDASAPNARIVQSGKPLYVTLRDGGIEFGPLEDTEHLLTLGVVPVAHQGRVIASLNVASHTLDEVPPHNRQALESVASRVGMAIARIQAEVARRASEDALRKGEILYRFLAQHSNDIVLVLDDQGIIRSASPSIRRVAGYEPSEWEGTSAFASVHPEDLPQILGAFTSKVHMAGTTARMAYRYRHKNGEWLHVEADAVNLLYDPDVRGVLVNVRDITERWRTEEALERARVLLESVIDHSPVPIAVVSSPDLVVRYANRAAVEFLGTSKEPSYAGMTMEEVRRRKTWQDYRPDGTRVDFGDLPLARALRGEHVRNEELYVVCQDGTLRWELVNGAPVYSRGGELVAGVIVFPDITERKRAEEALRSRESMLRSLFRAVPIGLTFSVGRRLMSVNESMCEITGYTEAELVGADAQMLYAAQQEYDDVGRDLFSQAAQKGRGSVEARFRRKDGALIDVILTGAMVRAGDPSAGFAVTVQDITARKRTDGERSRLQEQLQQAMKMEAVGRLAGGVAHDFNNLLTTILGNIDLAKLDLDAEHPLRLYLDEVEKASESAASLTRQLLAFSRKQLIEPRVLDLNDLIENLHKMLVRLIGEDILLETIPGPDLGSVKADPGQIEQVLVNLAINARDAMPNGGRLAIQTANVELDEAYCARNPRITPGQHVLLAISDTGHGMTAEVRSHLFEPFFTTKPMGRGTGLGLATIFGIVEQAGGAIEVDSEAGRGTTFRILLPRVDEEARKFVPEKPPHDLPTGHETILLVEDEESVRHLGTRVLNQLGYDVLPAANGAEALAVSDANRGRIDLLLTDVVMPGMNGRELAERLRQSCPEMKVLFTSGYTEDTGVRSGVIEEHLNFIGKPYSIPSLAAKVREVLGPARDPG